MSPGGLTAADPEPAARGLFLGRERGLEEFREEAASCRSSSAIRTGDPLAESSWSPEAASAASKSSGTALACTAWVCIDATHPRQTAARIRHGRAVGHLAPVKPAGVVCDGYRVIF